MGRGSLFLSTHLLSCLLCLLQGGRHPLPLPSNIRVLVVERRKEVDNITEEGVREEGGREGRREEGGRQTQ